MKCAGDDQSAWNIFSMCSSDKNVIIVKKTLINYHVNDYFFQSQIFSTKKVEFSNGKTIFSILKFINWSFKLYFPSLD